MFAALSDVFTAIFSEEDRTSVLEDQLAQLKHHEMDVRDDASESLMEAADLIAHISEINPLTLLADLEHTWCPLILQAVRSTDVQTQRKAAQALERLTEPLSGLRTKLHDRIVLELMEWLPPLVALGQSSDNLTQAAASEVLNRVGIFSHRPLLKIIADHGLSPLHCLAASRQPSAQRAAVAALASLLVKDKESGGKTIREIGLRTLFGLAASEDERTSRTAALAVASLQNNAPNEFSEAELDEMVTSEDCLPLLIRVARSSPSTAESGAERPLQTFCVRILAHTAAQQPLQARMIEGGAAAALIWIARQQIQQMAPCKGPGAKSTSVYVPQTVAASAGVVVPATDYLTAAAHLSTSEGETNMTNTALELNEASACATPQEQANHCNHQVVATLLPQPASAHQQIVVRLEHRSTHMCMSLCVCVVLLWCVVLTAHIAEFHCPFSGGQGSGRFGGSKRFCVHDSR
jgi:hypothetical protein